MFEHARSRNRLVAWELDALNVFRRRIGPEVNRDTVADAQRPGFLVGRITCTYLDIFLAVEVHKLVPPRLPQPLPSASRRKETRYDQEFEPQSEGDD